MKAALFGTGSIGQRHMRNLCQLQPDIQFVIVRSGARRDALSDQYNAQVVATASEAISMMPDLAIVATPSHVHTEPIAQMLQAGIACYVEKPAVIKHVDVQHLTTLLNTLKPTPITLSGCNLRFLPSLQRLRALIQQGSIGRTVRAQLQVGQWLPDWRPTQDYRTSYSADPDQGGGVVFDLIHELDMARWLFGEFDQCAAVGGHYSSLEISSEDTAAIVLGRAGGPAISVALDYISRQSIRRYEIVGEKGTLVWDLFSKTLAHHTKNKVHLIDCGPVAFDLTQTYPTALQALLDAYQTGQPCPNDLQEGLRSAALAIRIVEQLRVKT